MKISDIPFTGFTLLPIITVILLFIMGCISPSVESRKDIFLLSNPLCEINCTAGKVTVNMNSGTSVKAEIDQDVSPETDIKLK